MVTDKFEVKRHLPWVGLLLGCSIASITWAGATLDGSMGSMGSYSGDFTIPDTVGKTVGSNLFHSFSDFSINAGESATFTGPASIDNVISRVTGSSPSTFNGPLNSEIPGANFYFLNPNGILFKENAQINVDGSFYATTSDFVRLGQDGIFYADLGAQSNLTSSPPSAFGFLNGNPGQISMEGTQLVKYFTLNQPDGATLSLVGGDISIDQAPAGTATFFGTETSTGSFLSSTGNRIEAVSVGSSGEAVPHDGTYDLSSFSSLGKIDIANGSVIDATDTYIKGGQIVINSSAIAPGFFVVPNMAPFPQEGGSVNIAGSEQVDITGSGGPLEIDVNVPGSGPTTITRVDGEPMITGVTTFGGSPFPGDPEPNVPNVHITGGDVKFSGSSGVISERLGPSEAGDITINGDTIEVLDGSLIVNLNLYGGAGGDITLNADQVTIDSEGTVPFTGFTGLNAASNFSPLYNSDNLDPALASADAGNITINAMGAGGLVVHGADITTESRSFGTAGDITVNASDIGLSTYNGETWQIASQSLFSGDAGQITLNASGNIQINNAYVISSVTYGTGNAGNISITAGAPITITGGNSGVQSSSVQPTPEMEDLFASKFGAENFGQIVAFLADAGLVAPDADFFDVLGALQLIGLIDVGDPNPTAGDAGTLTLVAPGLDVSGLNSRISSSTTSDGNGGPINIQVGSLTVKDGAEIRSRSGLTNPDTGQVEVGAGNGGTININVKDSIDLTDGGTISASSLGTGLAGDIVIDAGNKFNLDSGLITTQATISDGGNILITAPFWVYLLNSDITTSVESGVGNGGNITIDPQFVILNQSSILANAYGGNGGNINIIADNVISSTQSRINASSALGIDGTVNISSPDQDVAQELAVLPENFLDVTGLINDRCGAKTGASSLVPVGPGGLGIDPDGYLPSFGAMTNAVYNGQGKSSGIGSGKPWWALAVDTPALQLARVTCTR